MTHTLVYALPYTRGPILPVKEYREIMGDTLTPDQQIVEKIAFLESFCRSIIKGEIE